MFKSRNFPVPSQYTREWVFFTPLSLHVHQKWLNLHGKMEDYTRPRPKPRPNMQGQNQIRKTKRKTITGGFMS